MSCIVISLSTIYIYMHGMAYVLLQVSVGRVLCLFLSLIMTETVTGMYSSIFYHKVR